MAKSPIGLFVDADGHVVEPPDMLQRYIEPRFRDLVPRHSLDAEGYDVLEPVRTGLGLNNAFFPEATVRPNCMPNNAGRPWEMSIEPFRKGVKGAWDPTARMKDMDTDGIDVAVLYPTFALGFIEDPALYGAVCRAYNEWVADYCKASPKRLFAVAAIALQDIDGAVRELERCVAQHGFVGAFIRPNPYVDHKKLHDPVYDPLWRAAQELDVAIGIHPYLMEDMPGAVRGMRLYEDVDAVAFKQALGNPFDMMTALASFTLGGIFERFPRLRVAFLEANGGWVVPMLERYDHHFEVWHSQLPCRTKPSELFARGGYISFDVDEKTLTATARLLGADRLIWASDYPHPDAKLPGAVAELKETVSELDLDDQRRVVGQNAIDLYRLPL
jgi:predicted TIM-barrel fold metal-dependent hydrolase